MSVLDSYKIVTIVRSKNKQKDRNGASYTGRTLVIQITYEIAYSYAGKVIFQDEFKDDWTAKYSDEELIGKEW